jgi:hypothetical protein
LRISIRQKGDLSKTENFLKRNLHPKYITILERYGREGIAALSLATPVDTGETANAWRYEIRQDPGEVVISWMNSNTSGGVPIAILIQYGHATKNGGFVQGRDFINPALKPVFDKIAFEAWKEVIR